MNWFNGTLRRTAAYAGHNIRTVLDALRGRIGCLLGIQCAVYAFAYDALMPRSMYFSPDSVLYLSVSNIVPPTFSLLGRALVETELAFGNAYVVLLRYLSMAIYCIGGWLIARALVRSGRPWLALLVLPVIWSMSALTQWFNYFLTDGIATALLIACIGAYANMIANIQAGESRGTMRWAVFFVCLGVLSFSMRPAFAFIVPAMVIMAFNRTVFSWSRVAGITAGAALLVVAHFSFAKYWHGEVESKLGGNLTALVFDLPLPISCAELGETDMCKAQRALKPFIGQSLNIASAHHRYIYKVLNNGYVSGAAMVAVKEGKTEGQVNTVLADLAMLKIKSNVFDYIAMVLTHSYYSVKTWGDRYRHDSLGAVALQGIAITNENAAAVRAVARVDFDPRIHQPPVTRIYKDFLLQPPRLLPGGNWVNLFTLPLVLVAVLFSTRPLLRRTSVAGSILFACCVFGILGTIFQNAVFPVIPRLMEPFQPLGALGVLMLLAMSATRIRAEVTSRWQAKGAGQIRVT